MKNIIVACGGGIATSSTVASKINSALEDRGLAGKARVEAVDIKSLDMYMSSADIYVSITPTARAKQEFPIPVVSGIPFLTGVGREETMEELVRLIKK